MEEAIWCCLHDGGLALAEYARQAVTWRDEAIHVNLLVPGKYRLPIPGNLDVEVRILTNYPTTADTVIEARHVPANVNVHLRIPTCVRHPVVSEIRDADTVLIRLNGKLTHHVEQCNRGRMLYYGPLVLVPLGYSWSGGKASDSERANVPSGYIPDDMPQGLPELQVDTGDIDDLMSLGDQSLPDWTYFDEGPGSRCAVQGSAVNIPLKFPDGQVRLLRFVPECYFTSCLALHETPIVFG